MLVLIGLGVASVGVALVGDCDGTGVIEGGGCTVGVWSMGVGLALVGVAAGPPSEPLLRAIAEPASATPPTAATATPASTIRVSRRFP
ncbi:hypothetical protein [Kribbella solani]|uniref:Uncharacterized protein n=1 Tax=Kribbella solani TaxID=236067 RepID=A0A841DXQ4_9ACTN|nr:hypothetical protein [Kribbella solani]MBB5981550.1 hypothetical protein [Kribbella solani]